ncbi:hypothetical protein [Leptospira santarosai]|uniref:hypothetical protein n=1 Tax=Leptospira santarosai TaxID=28183 RepID=UPI0024AFB3ED|nr:hypothetical protein [Leptospira santarosai]MDI7213794.1 hypothetical protein [Leptospira santarosai]
MKLRLVYKIEDDGKRDIFVETKNGKFDILAYDFKFLTGFVEGFKHLKGTGSGEIYETGKAYGAREFHEMTSRRDDRAFRKAMKQKYNHTNQERIK